MFLVKFIFRQLLAQNQSQGQRLFEGVKQKKRLFHDLHLVSKGYLTLR